MDLAKDRKIVGDNACWLFFALLMFAAPKKHRKIFALTCERFSRATFCNQCKKELQLKRNLESHLLTISENDRTVQKYVICKKISNRDRYSGVIGDY